MRFHMCNPLHTTALLSWLEHTQDSHGQREPRHRTCSHKFDTSSITSSTRICDLTSHRRILGSDDQNLQGCSTPCVVFPEVGHAPSKAATPCCSTNGCRPHAGNLQGYNTPCVMFPEVGHAPSKAATPCCSTGGCRPHAGNLQG